MSPEYQKKLALINRLGLHVRAATQLVKVAEAFDCEVLIDREGFNQVNGKSIMSVLTLAAPVKSEILVTTRGADAEQALEAITQLVNNRFGEDD